MQRRLVADGAPTALVQAHAGGIQKDLADIFHDGKPELIGRAGLRQPAQTVVRRHAVDRRLFHDRLAVRHAVQLTVQTVALDGEGGILRKEPLERDGLDALIERLEGERLEARQKDHHALAHAQAQIGARHVGKVAVKEDPTILHAHVFHLHPAQLIAHQSFQPKQAGHRHRYAFHFAIPP